MTREEIIEKLKSGLFVVTYLDRLPCGGPELVHAVTCTLRPALIAKDMAFVAEPEWLDEDYVDRILFFSRQGGLAVYALDAKGHPVPGMGLGGWKDIPIEKVIEIKAADEARFFRRF